MTSTLSRRFTAVLATAALMTAGLPAPAHAAGPHPQPPRAATPPDRVAYMERASDTTSAVPQCTAAT
jgi:hypothetical protein